jgi:phasin family protein
MPTKQEYADQTLETAVPEVAPAPAEAPPLEEACAPVAKVVPEKVPSAAKPKPVSKAITPKKAAPKAAAKVVKKKAPSPKPKAAAAKVNKQAAPVSTGVMTMNEFVSKFAEQAKARAEAMSAEFGARTQEAVEFSKSNVEAVVESSKIAAKNLEALREEGMSFARKSFEENSAAMKSLTSVSSPMEFFKLLTENNKKAFEAAVAQTSKNSEFLVKMTTESFAPISNRMSVISAKLKVA